MATNGKSSTLKNIVKVPEEMKGISSVTLTINHVVLSIMKRSNVPLSLPEQLEMGIHQQTHFGKEPCDNRECGNSFVCPRSHAHGMLQKAL
ncbi:hypothetical protein STEG23_013823 [Scotinomys teguina]